jgi:hypothetical protein
MGITPAARADGQSTSIGQPFIFWTYGYMPINLDDNDDPRPSDRSLMTFGAVFVIGVAVLIAVGWYFS